MQWYPRIPNGNDFISLYHSILIAIHLPVYGVDDLHCMCFRVGFALAVIQYAEPKILLFSTYLPFGFLLSY